VPSRVPVTVLGAIDARGLDRLFAPYELTLIRLAPAAQVPGSYWGAPEAGLLRGAVFARRDTPVHSVLHEAAHYVCVTSARRLMLWRDAGGDSDEECAACYLQAVWSDELAGYSRQRLFADMDAWGYSFREGSAEHWYRGDAHAAREWLLERGLIDGSGRSTGRLRMRP
jgi:hypothetical protein